MPIGQTRPALQESPPRDITAPATTLKPDEVPTRIPTNHLGETTGISQ